MGRSQGESFKSWESKLTSSMLHLHKEIWDGHNTFVHGKTIDESRQKAREAVLNRVNEIYKQPPSLASCYPSIFELPLENRLKRTTDQLNDCLKRIKHQKRESDILHSTLPAEQLTLQNAYDSKGYSTQRKKDFPP
jgi:hypothetical protein